MEATAKASHGVTSRACPAVKTSRRKKCNMKFFRLRTITGSFTVCWLLTLIESLGIFLVADFLSFFLSYALVSLPAYGLVTYDGTPDCHIHPSRDRTPQKMPSER